MDYGALRAAMVAGQIAARGVTNARVLDAMRRVPRHLFVPEDLAVNAYDDRALPIGLGQTISQPYMVASMTEALRLTGSEKVLEIGTGSGYQTAVLAELSREVFSIERIDSLSIDASIRLRSLGYVHAHLVTGDGTLGLPEHAPFDRILVTAGAPEPPPPLLAQLAEGGRLVIPVGSLTSQQIVVYTKVHGEIAEERYTYCTFVPLIGTHGWGSEDS
jgi:protein-L-isoaspartate(D-aspartate) O-methyltransferase